MLVTMLWLWWHRKRSEIMDAFHTNTTCITLSRQRSGRTSREYWCFVPEALRTGECCGNYVNLSTEALDKM